MLILRRTVGQEVVIRHRSGDLIRIVLCRIRMGRRRDVNLGFTDDARNFSIERPDRRTGPSVSPPSLP